MTLEYSSLVTVLESVPYVRLERSVPELTRVGKVDSLTVDLAKCRARLAVFARQYVEHSRASPPKRYMSAAVVHAV